MRTLLISPYAPARDGIAAYAVQVARQLRHEGEEVTVLSPSPSAAHLHLAYAGPRGSAALARRVRAYDKVVVQYHPMFHYDSASFPRRSATDVILGEAIRLAKESVAYVHEVEYEEFRTSSARRAAGEFFWSGFDQLVFHSETELENFREVFPKAARRGVVSAHGESFFRRTDMDREEARRSLGIGDETVFLSIGFIQRHKGFDRAVRAFSGLDAYNARFDIVGSTRTDEPDFVQYLEELRFLSEHTPGVRLHDGYTSDEKFDRWISASDVVVLPYRSIWSSGVLERAKLFDKKVIASRVGGLEEQADADRTTLISTDQELRAAMAEAVGAPAGARVAEWEIEEQAPWSEIQAELERRAAASTGLPRARRARGVENGSRGRAGAIAPLRNLPGYVSPAPTSSRPGVSSVKRLVDRAVGWRVDPLARQVEMLRLATLRTVENVERQLPDDARAVADGPSDEPGHASRTSSSC